MYLLELQDSEDRRTCTQLSRCIEKGRSETDKKGEEIEDILRLMHDTLVYHLEFLTDIIMNLLRI